MRLHTDAFTHRQFHTQIILLTHACTRKRIYTHTRTHATVYTRSPKIRTNALSHKETFTSRPCYIQTLLHGRRGETSQLIGSLQEQKLARKKITESDDCLSSSSILPAQKDDATFLFCPDGRATKPSGFHTASKKSSVPTGLLPASLWSRSRKPCRAAWTGQQEDLCSPQSAAEVHVEPSGWLPCIELSTDNTEQCPFSKVQK